MAGRGVVKPSSLAELMEAVHENERVVIRGSGSKRQFCEERSGTAVDLTSLRASSASNRKIKSSRLGRGRFSASCRRS